jgi:N6-L-threonylcarbamoyladenine synthase
VELAGVETLILGGGVAANSRLQARLTEEGGRRGFRVLFPPRELCTDNAGMIAAVGHSLLSRGDDHGLTLDTTARCPLTAV